MSGTDFSGLLRSLSLWVSLPSDFTLMRSPMAGYCIFQMGRARYLTPLW